MMTMYPLSTMSQTPDNRNRNRHQKWTRRFSDHGNQITQKMSQLLRLAIARFRIIPEAKTS